MKNFFIKLFTLLLLCCNIFICSCNCNNSKSLLDPKNPVTLTLWHVYGEQADSPMNKQINEFNQTVGKEKGIIINVTNVSNAANIGSKLLDAQANKPGALDMPDLFFCHLNNAISLGVDNLINWNTLFTEKELNNYIDSFLNDGKKDDKQVVLPVTKSTQLLFVAGDVFNEFSTECDVSLDDLKTWDGFFEVAKKYYEYSRKPFCSLDYLLRSVELNAIASGSSDFYDSPNSWYNLNNKVFMDSYAKFAKSIAQGHIIVSDLYANTQMMTGEVIAGIGSSASILYYSDKITYPDNSQKDMNLQILPLPQTADASVSYSTQAGVGLCGYKSTEKKSFAAKIFAEWFNEDQRNLEFATETGYMPVKKATFEKMSTYNFSKASYQRLYKTINYVVNNHQFLSETTMENYYQKTSILYSSIRKTQALISERLNSGEKSENIAIEIIEMLYK